MVTKRVTQAILYGDETLLCLDWSGRYMNIHTGQNCTELNISIHTSKYRYTCGDLNKIGGLYQY